MGDLTFKVTIKNQLAQLSGLISVYLAIGVMFYLFFGLSLRPPIAYIFMAMFLFDILPTLLVHIQYYKANMGVVLDIDKQLRRIGYITTNGVFSYRFDEIEFFVRCDSRLSGGWNSFSGYRYYKIIFRDKREIYITSLMIRRIKYVLEPLLGRKPDVKGRLIAFIK
jgi:hypothetical protein